MTNEDFKDAVVRVVLLAIGIAATIGMVYAVGRYGIPWTDAADKAILVAINPATHIPGLDEFMRATTDYTNYLIFTPLLSWTVAFLLYSVYRNRKPVITGLLAAETLILAGMAVAGKIWPNKTYVGANVLLVLMTLAIFGTATYLFHRTDYAVMRRAARLFWIILISTLLTNDLATEFFKKTVARPRPLNDANKPWNEQIRPIPDELLRGRNSYPSGHTSGTFSLITPVFWYVSSRRLRTALIGWGVLQGVTRVYTAAHFPLCVTMGGVLGFVIGTMVFFALGPLFGIHPPGKPAAAGG